MNTPVPPRPTRPPDPSGSGKKLPIGRWVLVASLLFAFYAWTFGPYGIVRQQRTAERLRTLEAGNDSLRARLRSLEDSLRLLSTDSATIASKARLMGLVLPGEVAVRFVDTSSAAKR